MNPVESPDGWTTFLQVLNALIMISILIGIPAVIVYVIVLLRRIAKNTDPERKS